MPRRRTRGAEIACRLSTILCLLAACAADTPAPSLVFAPVTEAAEAHRIRSTDLSLVRAQVWSALADGESSRHLAGSGTWETLGVGTGEVDAGRTYVRRGGGLLLDVRLGAGDRGAMMGGVAALGAERAMVQVRLADPETLGARFAIRIWGPGLGPRLTEELTPRHLRQRLPRGVYRGWIDVPPAGGRFAVEVQTYDGAGERVASAYSSPIEVRRPWRAGRSKR